MGYQAMGRHSDWIHPIVVLQVIPKKVRKNHPLQLLLQVMPPKSPQNSLYIFANYTQKILYCER